MNFKENNVNQIKEDNLYLIGHLKYRSKEANFDTGSSINIEFIKNYFTFKL